MFEKTLIFQHFCQRKRHFHPKDYQNIDAAPDWRRNSQIWSKNNGRQGASDWGIVNHQTRISGPPTTSLHSSLRSHAHRRAPRAITTLTILPPPRHHHRSETRRKTHQNPTKHSTKRRRLRPRATLSSILNFIHKNRYRTFGYLFTVSRLPGLAAHSKWSLELNFTRFTLISILQ